MSKELKSGDSVVAYRDLERIDTVFLYRGYADGYVCVAPHHVSSYYKGSTCDTVYFSKVHRLEDDPVVEKTMEVEGMSGCSLCSAGRDIVVSASETSAVLKLKTSLDNGVAISYQITFPTVGEYLVPLKVSLKVPVSLRKL